MNQLEAKKTKSDGVNICFASFRKTVCRPVEVSLDSSLKSVDSLCYCTAGQISVLSCSRCVYVRGKILPLHPRCGRD